MADQKIQTENKTVLMALVLSAGLSETKCHTRPTNIQGKLHLESSNKSNHSGRKRGGIWGVFLFSGGNSTNLLILKLA